mgnify:CR=1 FL=1|jgi:hypothetical protein
MQGVEYEPLVTLLDAHRKDSGHWWLSGRQKQTAFTLKDEVQVLILIALLKHVIASTVFFFQKLHFKLFDLFETNFVLVPQMRDKPQKKVDFFYRDSKLVLCDNVLVDVSIDLNDLSLLLFTSRKIVSLHTALSEAEKCVLIDVMHKLF